MPIRADYTYPPELIEAMRLAFYKTCKALHLSDTDDAFTDVVGTKIIELAKAGEGDPDRLCSKSAGSAISAAESFREHTPKLVARIGIRQQTRTAGLLPIICCQRS